MEALRKLDASLTPVLSDPRYSDYLAILKGARNGLVYGAKIRFPHALVMQTLFGRGDIKTRSIAILRATKQHSLNLCKFVTIYKTLLLLQRKLNAGKQRTLDPFFAGLVGGWAVFGERNAVNEQIVLYVLSRVVFSFLPRAQPDTYPPPSDRPVPPSSKHFTVTAALVWAAVMWLFENRRKTLQGGMVNSMQYLYKDSDSWNSLRTLLWHNK